jgi:hypothetical protein
LAMASRCNHSALPVATLSVELHERISGDKRNLSERCKASDLDENNFAMECTGLYATPAQPFKHCGAAILAASSELHTAVRDHHIDVHSH